MIPLKSRLLPLACLALLCLSSLAQAKDYDANQYFNSTTNTDLTNPFKYGFETSLGGTFNLYTNYTTGLAPFSSQIAAYNVPASPSGLPGVLYNTSSNAYSLNTGGTTINIGGNQLALHPGSDGQYSIVRFTVQKTGLYNVSGLFAGADTRPTTTDVHILFNNTIPLLSGDINPTGQVVGGSNTVNYALSHLQLTSGDTLDFAVGYGANGNYTYDTTVFNAHVAAVPELSTMLGFGSFVAFGGLAAFRQRKKTRKAA